MNLCAMFKDVLSHHLTVQVTNPKEKHPLAFPYYGNESLQADTVLCVP